MSILKNYREINTFLIYYTSLVVWPVCGPPGVSVTTQYNQWLSRWSYQCYSVGHLIDSIQHGVWSTPLRCKLIDGTNLHNRSKKPQLITNLKVENGFLCHLWTDEMFCWTVVCNIDEFKLEKLEHFYLAASVMPKTHQSATKMNIQKLYEKG